MPKFKSSLFGHRYRHGFHLDSSAAAPSPGDPYWSNVQVFQTFDGTNGSTVFTDQNPNHARVWTRAGSGAALSNAQSKFGTTSFAGNADDIMPNTLAGITMAADFTYEAWIWLTDATAALDIVTLNSTATAAGFQVSVKNNTTGGQLDVITGASHLISGALNSWPTAQWVFLQVVRNAGTLGANQGGVSVGTIADTHTANAFQTGKNSILGYNSTNGFIANLRYTEGVARANVVPTAPFPNHA